MLRRLNVSGADRKKVLQPARVKQEFKTVEGLVVAPVRGLFLGIQ